MQINPANNNNKQTNKQKRHKKNVRVFTKKKSIVKHLFFLFFLFSIDQKPMHFVSGSTIIQVKDKWSCTEDWMRKCPHYPLPPKKLNKKEHKIFLFSTNCVQLCRYFADQPSAHHSSPLTLHFVSCQTGFWLGLFLCFCFVFCFQ